MISVRVCKQACRIVTLGLLLLQSACVGKSPKPDFFLLEPLADDMSEPLNQTLQRPLIALSPVSLAKYLDRSQIVQSGEKNSYQLNETKRWAEPLNDNIDRVLSGNLARLIPADIVSPNVSTQAREAELKIYVTIIEFHITPEQIALLRAQWSIRQIDKTVATRQSEYRLPASSTDYKLMVAALNACIDKLSRDIAATVRSFLR